jgi:hypothetical protein
MRYYILICRPLHDPQSGYDIALSLRAVDPFHHLYRLPDSLFTHAKGDTPEAARSVLHSVRQRVARVFPYNDALSPQNDT